MAGYTLKQLGISGSAIILAEGYFATFTGKTANGLVRLSRVLKIVGVIDSKNAGKDSGEMLDGKRNGIPIFGSLEESLSARPDWLIIGVASIGGRLPAWFRPAVKQAIQAGVNILSGLHEKLSEDKEFTSIAKKKDVRIIDLRKPRSLYEMSQYSALAEKIDCARIPILGTDGSVGKRTTGWLLYGAMSRRGMKAEFVATGQTGLLQGADYGVPLDSLLGDYMVGELEAEIYRAWQEKQPEVIIVEGQGAISHPAYVCGTRAIICASKPTAMVVQHAPGRKVRNFGKDSLGLPMPKIENEIQVLKIYSGSDIIAITINHEGMSEKEVDHYKAWTRRELGLPSWDVLRDGADELALLIKEKCVK